LKRASYLDDVNGAGNMNCFFFIYNYPEYIKKVLTSKIKYRNITKKKRTNLEKIIKLIYYNKNKKIT